MVAAYFRCGRRHACIIIIAHGAHPQRFTPSRARFALASRLAPDASELSLPDL